MAQNPKIDYESLVQEALRSVVKKVLTRAAERGLPGDHHFYLSFRTDYPGVDLPNYLKAQYPEEITIVLQYEFWDLEVHRDCIFVTLCFNDVNERLAIPLNAIVSFVDPSVKFGLQFEPSIHDEEAAPAKKTEADASIVVPDPSTEKSPPSEDGSNVVTLDAFRKK